MMQAITYNYAEAIRAIKKAILKSRYNAAVLANREMLMLYLGVGEYISKNSREGTWGTNAIETISAQLQNELPGLRGFSVSNIKNMRGFYEAWKDIVPNRQTGFGDLQRFDIDEVVGDITIRRIPLGEFDKDPTLRNFVSVGFSHHCIIIASVKSPEERLFYIHKCAIEFWSVEKLKYNIKSDLYAREGKIVNNFALTIPDIDFRGKALRSFKDEYLLDYINIEDPYDADEREIENHIALNIKKFIMTLGNDFSFIGNQYRITVDNFAFRDTSKPMGVATYRIANELPIEYRGILPDADQLIKVLNIDQL